MLNYHFIILSLEEQESAVIILQIGKLRLQKVKSLGMRAWIS